MHYQRLFNRVILIALGIGASITPQIVRAEQAELVPSSQTSAYELILAMNTLRVSNGLPALIEDPIINAVAQSTAEIMAANNMSWHIGDVRGRLAVAGYGGGGTVWATENFAVSSGGMGIDQIMAVWADPDHMRPAVNPAYCNVGAGVATVNGKTYYILQAAYVSGQECGSYASSGSSEGGNVVPPVSQIIIPVQIATPDEDGNVYHTVQSGQSFWSIAIAYQITIQDLETWNNISRNIPLQSGQRLYIPGKNTEGYATPTPIGMVAVQAPDADGRIIHEVQPYQTLTTIAKAYNVTVERILALNGLQADWPLSIGQKLLIYPGNVTPSPTLSAVQKLTPEADGNYYHTIQSGETLSYIAGLYEVPLANLMSWNGLTNESIIFSGQKLLLLVTPPATATFIPRPTTTPLPTDSPTIQSPPTQTPPGAVTESPPSRVFNAGVLVGIIAVVFVIGGFIWWRFSRKN